MTIVEQTVNMIYKPDNNFIDYCIMNRVRPFINRFVKQRQLEMNDSFHGHNLKEMKPVATRFLEHS